MISAEDRSKEDQEGLGNRGQEYEDKEGLVHTERIKVQKFSEEQ